METFFVELAPRGSFTSELNSDTLFGAVCWALADLQLADVSALLRDFNASPAFAFSSVFPYLHGNGSRIRLFPMPLIPPLRVEQVRTASQSLPIAKRNSKLAERDGVQRAKLLNKVTLVSERLFGEIVRGELHMAGLWRRVDTDILIVSGALITREELDAVGYESYLPSFIATADVQRNQIDRVAGGTVEGLLFYDHQTFLRREHAGLWCLVRTNHPDWMQAAFRYLADTGIGGRRTSGRNQFAIQMSASATIPEVEQEANALVLLSRYIPAKDEKLAGAPLAYRLRNVRGKHETKFPIASSGTQSPPIYKRLVRMLSEGSVLPLVTRKEIYGRIVEAGTIGERMVWHSGLAMAAQARIRTGT